MQGLVAFGLGEVPVSGELKPPSHKLSRRRSSRVGLKRPLNVGVPNGFWEFPSSYSKSIRSIEHPQHCKRDTMKRKAESEGPPEASKKAKRQAASHKDHFRAGLFDQSMLKDYQKAYAASEP